MGKTDNKNLSKTEKLKALDSQPKQKVKKTTQAISSLAFLESILPGT